MIFRKFLTLMTASFALAFTPALAGGPVIVELFTSQSCPNSPKGDATLAQIADRSDVIALSYPVSMWDWRGWKDSFAKSEFDQRQAFYSKRLKSLSRYTPQMVVSGNIGVRADNMEAVEASLADMTHQVADLSLLVENDTYTALISEENMSGDAALVLTSYNPATVSVEINKGRNAGKTLQYRNIVTGVKQLKIISTDQQSFSFPRPDLSGDLACVLMLQDMNTGSIKSAVRCPQ